MKGTFLLLALLVACACSQPKQANTAGLPSFQMTMLTGEKVMSHALHGRTILIFYNPDCDHCQREAEAIRSRLEDFRKYSLYFIAASPDENVKRFAGEYDLLNQDNIFFASAEVDEVIREMGPMGTPCLFIYSEDGQLIKKFDGETPVEEIVRAL